MNGSQLASRVRRQREHLAGDTGCDWSIAAAVACLLACPWHAWACHHGML